MSELTDFLKKWYAYQQEQSQADNNVTYRRPLSDKIGSVAELNSMTISRETNAKLDAAQKDSKQSKDIPRLDQEVAALSVFRAGVRHRYLAGTSKSPRMLVRRDFHRRAMHEDMQVMQMIERQLKVYGK